MLVLRTLGAPQRRLLRGRRGRRVSEVPEEPVPTTRVTVVRPRPFDSGDQAAGWLGELRGDRAAADQEVRASVRQVNRAIHAHRVAAADPWAREVSEAGALVVRVGYGPGETVAEGRFTEAWMLAGGG